MANYTPGEAIMFCAIFVCLFALALLALARPLRMLCKCGISAVLGAFLLFLGKSLGAAVGINAATLAVSAFLGLPGVAGIFLLSLYLVNGAKKTQAKQTVLLKKMMKSAKIKA